MQIFDVFVIPGKSFFIWGLFCKMNFRRRPFNQKPLVFRKKSRTNLEARGPLWRYLAMK